MHFPACALPDFPTFPVPDQGENHSRWKMEILWFIAVELVQELWTQLKDIFYRSAIAAKLWPEA